MNIENAKKLVGQLERLPDEKFKIASLIEHHKCGTVACIAGWASLLNGGPKKLRESNVGDHNYTAWNFACKFLGFASDDAAAKTLFYGRWPSGRGLYFTTRSDAIAELNRMIAEAEKASA